MPQCAVPLQDRWLLDTATTSGREKKDVRYDTKTPVLTLNNDIATNASVVYMYVPEVDARHAQDCVKWRAA